MQTIPFQDQNRDRFERVRRHILYDSDTDDYPLSYERLVSALLQTPAVTQSEQSIRSLSIERSLYLVVEGRRVYDHPISRTVSVRNDSVVRIGFRVINGMGQTTPAKGLDQWACLKVLRNGQRHWSFLRNESLDIWTWDSELLERKRAKRQTGTRHVTAKRNLVSLNGDCLCNHPNESPRLDLTNDKTGIDSALLLQFHSLHGAQLFLFPSAFDKAYTMYDVDTEGRKQNETKIRPRIDGTVKRILVWDRIRH